jgi:hypothetical protein
VIKLIFDDRDGEWGTPSGSLRNNEGVEEKGEWPGKKKNRRAGAKQKGSRDRRLFVVIIFLVVFTDGFRCLLGCARLGGGRRLRHI